MVLNRFTLLLAFCSALILSSCVSNLPEDEQMIANFHENEAEFRMLLEKVEGWETYSWITPTSTQKLSSYVPSFSETQASEIQAQMVELGVRGLLVDPEPNDGTDGLRILMKTADTGDNAKRFWRTGPYSAGKGYAYLAEPLPRCAFEDNLDDINFNNVDLKRRCDPQIYRRIHGNWFLYIEGPESS